MRRVRRGLIIALVIGAASTHTVLAQNTRPTPDKVWAAASKARKQGDCESAVRLYSRAMGMVRAWPEGSRYRATRTSVMLLYRGMCLRRLKRHARAMDDLSHAAESDYLGSQSWLPDLELAILFADTGRAAAANWRVARSVKEVEALLKTPRSMDFDPDDVRGHPRVGEPSVFRCLMNRSEPERRTAARRDCRRGLALAAERCAVISKTATEKSACIARTKARPLIVKARAALARMKSK